MESANASGKLVIVPTPIGNLGDMTLRSLEALRELSLLEQRETPQGARWCLVPAAGKKDLASAPILRRLEAAQ